MISSESMKKFTEAMNRVGMTAKVACKKITELNNCFYFCNAARFYRRKENDLISKRRRRVRNHGRRSL